MNYQSRSRTQHGRRGSSPGSGSSSGRRSAQLPIPEAPEDDGSRGVVIAVLVVAGLILLAVGGWLAMDSGHVQGGAPSVPSSPTGSGEQVTPPPSRMDSNRPPRAEIRLLQSAGFDREVQFSGIFSEDPDAADVDRLSYRWDFGDGSSDDRKLGSHTFTESGELTVTLTVTDPAGASDTTTQRITISEYPPIDPGRQADAEDRAGLVCLRVRGYVDHLADLERKLAEADQVIARRVELDNGVAPSQEYFGLSFRGGLVVEEPGSYQFQLISDDGSRLFLEGQELITMDRMQGATPASTVRRLKPGVYALRVDYYQGSADRALTLKWGPPGGGLEVIGENAFVHRASDIPE